MNVYAASELSSDLTQAKLATLLQIVYHTPHICNNCPSQMSTRHSLTDTFYNQIAMADYAQIPVFATLKPKPFEVSIPEIKLEQFKTLIALAPVGSADFNNSHPTAGNKYGIRRDWLLSAKDAWETEFSWRAYEARINSFPNYTVPVTGSDGEEIEVHFMALFSERADALPVAVSLRSHHGCSHAD